MSGWSRPMACNWDLCKSWNERKRKWRREILFPIRVCIWCWTGPWIADGNGFPFMRPAILYKQWLFEGVKWQVLHLCRFTASFEMFPKCIWNGRSKLGTRIETGGRVYSEESGYYALFFHLFILGSGVLVSIAVDVGNWVLRFGGVDIFEQTLWRRWLGVTA